MASIPSSGDQYLLSCGDDIAAIASVGASLRSYRHGDRDLVVPYEADEVRPKYRGALLAPWPNRVVDGRYTFAGQTYQLALTETDRGHALHGLLAWTDFQLVEQEAERVRLVATVVPQDGYPWRIEVATTFELTSDGLTQTVEATNHSAAPAPYGTAPHPYLVAGAGRVDDWELELPADRVLLVDERLAPAEIAEVTVDAERFDFRTRRRLGAVEIDHAYTGLGRTEGLVTIRLLDTAGAGVAMVFDDRCPWVQIHTADLGAGVPGHRAGLAVEPMTCAPDAFNGDPGDSGTGLLVLEPGATATAGWTIRPVDPR